MSCSLPVRSLLLLLFYAAFASRVRGVDDDAVASAPRQLLKPTSAVADAETRAVFVTGVVHMQPASRAAAASTIEHAASPQQASSSALWGSQHSHWDVRNINVTHFPGQGRSSSASRQLPRTRGSAHRNLLQGDPGPGPAPAAGDQEIRSWLQGVLQRLQQALGDGGDGAAGGGLAGEGRGAGQGTPVSTRPGSVSVSGGGQPMRSPAAGQQGSASGGDASDYGDYEEEVALPACTAEDLDPDLVSDAPLDAATSPLAAIGMLLSMTEVNATNATERERAAAERSGRGAGGVDGSPADDGPGGSSGVVGGRRYGSAAGLRSHPTPPAGRRGGNQSADDDGGDAVLVSIERCAAHPSTHTRQAPRATRYPLCMRTLQPAVQTACLLPGDATSPCLITHSACLCVHACKLSSLCMHGRVHAGARGRLSAPATSSPQRTASLTWRRPTTPPTGALRLAGRAGGRRWECSAPLRCRCAAWKGLGEALSGVRPGWASPKRRIKANVCDLSVPTLSGGHLPLLSCAHLLLLCLCCTCLSCWQVSEMLTGASSGAAPVQRGA